MSDKSNLLISIREYTIIVQYLFVNTQFLSNTLLIIWLIRLSMGKVTVAIFKELMSLCGSCLDSVLWSFCEQLFCGEILAFFWVHIDGRYYMVKICVLWLLTVINWNFRKVWKIIGLICWDVRVKVKDCYLKQVGICRHF